MAKANPAGWTFTPNASAKPLTDQAVFEAVQEIFEIDIKGEAVKGSPVKTGTNRRSIDTEVHLVPKGVQAEIFTQSGYGGYLEVGTRFMKGRPYLLPALNKFRAKLVNIIKQKIARAK